MEGSIEQRYMAAEHAYGAGDYGAAQRITETLIRALDEQEPTQEISEETRIKWRSVIALLRGHIELHGLNKPERAAYYYGLTTDSNPDEVIKELAIQGLKNIKNLTNTTKEESNTPTQKTIERTNQEREKKQQTDLTQDPFITATATQTTSPTPCQTATPWDEQFNTTLIDPRPAAALETNDSQNQVPRASETAEEAISEGNRDRLQNSTLQSQQKATEKSTMEWDFRKSWIRIRTK